jgi:hypothetical protein
LVQKPPPVGPLAPHKVSAPQLPVHAEAAHEVVPPDGATHTLLQDPQWLALLVRS